MKLKMIATNGGNFEDSVLGEGICSIQEKKVNSFCEDKEIVSITTDTHSPYSKYIVSSITYK